MVVTTRAGSSPRAGLRVLTNDITDWATETRQASAGDGARRQRMRIQSPHSILVRSFLTASVRRPQLKVRCYPRSLGWYSAMTGMGQEEGSRGGG